MSDGESLLQAVHAGEAPLEVYADWCEEQGFEWSEGVRRLAAAGWWPVQDHRGWYWRVDLSDRITQEPHPAILPASVWRHVHPRVYEAGRHAMFDPESPQQLVEQFRPPNSYPRFKTLAGAVERAARACLLDES